MSERDCGRWYCQKAAGFRRLVLGVDVLLYGGPRANDDDRKALIRERRAITGNDTKEIWPRGKSLGGWMGARRRDGWLGWLAAYSHGDGAAGHYWIWDPDSRGKYLEANGPFEPGSLPGDFGKMHGGLGWQLPLLAVFSEEPLSSDLSVLRRWKVPYVVQTEDVPVEPPIDPPDEPGIDWGKTDLGGTRGDRLIRLEAQSLWGLGMIAKVGEELGELHEDLLAVQSGVELIIDFLDIEEE